MRDYPAYGRTIAAHIIRGQKPICVGVMLSDGYWDRYNHVAKVCIRADEWALDRWEFGYLRGLHVVAVYGQCSAQQFGELLVELMRVGPSRIWAYDLNGTLLTPGDPYLVDEQSIGIWVHELGAMRVSDPRLKAARAIFRQAKHDAEVRFYDEVLKIAERTGGGDAVIRYGARRDEFLDRVRKLFSAPFQDIGEPAAA